MSRSFEAVEPEQFTCCTVGPAGQRVFYLQVVAERDLFTVRLEKQQVAALATYLRGVLDDLDVPVPTVGTPTEPLGIPEAEWIVGAMAIGIDEAAGHVVIVLEELVPEPEEDPDLAAEGATARIVLSREQAAGFVPGADALVSAGRPLCELCGRPMEPDRHVCPRKNGHGVH